jgi:hypothetical protein
LEVDVMPEYNQFAWLPLCAGLTVLGLAGSWLAWRRRGAAAGLRGMAWSLIPVALYLIGAISLVWEVAIAVTGFAAGFVLSLAVWAGVATVGLIVVLFLTSGLLRRRAGRRPQRAVAPAAGTAAVPAGAAGDDDDLAEVEELLRQRGIT